MFGSILNGLLGAASGLGDVASALVAFFQTITNPYMWRSLAWLLLGMVMMVAGAALLLRRSARSI